MQKPCHSGKVEALPAMQSFGRAVYEVDDEVHVAPAPRVLAVFGAHVSNNHAVETCVAKLA